MCEGSELVLGEAILIETGTVVQAKDMPEKHVPGGAQGECSRSLDESSDMALEQLVRQHTRLVYRIAYAVLRCHHDAEDATQETFLRVLRYRRQLHAVENPKTWLARIVWRVAIDRCQKQGRRREVTLDDWPATEVWSSEVPAYETVRGSQISAVLEKLIVALPKKLREPLILSTVQEMSPVEVAATLGINEAAVRSRVFRARQMLQERMATQGARR